MESPPGRTGVSPKPPIAGEVLACMVFSFAEMTSIVMPFQPWGPWSLSSLQCCRNLQEKKKNLPGSLRSLFKSLNETIYGGPEAEHRKWQVDVCVCVPCTCSIFLIEGLGTLPELKEKNAKTIRAPKTVRSHLGCSHIGFRRLQVPQRISKDIFDI